MRSFVPFFAALFMAFQLVMAVPAILPMVYGGLVSNQLRTDRECTCLSLHWIDLANNFYRRIQPHKARAGLCITSSSQRPHIEP